MNTEITDVDDRKGARGCVFYDADCPLCVGLAHRFTGILARRHFTMAPLQGSLAARRLGLADGEPLAEMRLATSDGKTYGGANAIVELARHYWWALPIVHLARLNSGRRLLESFYRWIADRRTCSTGVCRRNSTNVTMKRPGINRTSWTGLIPFVLLPVIAMIALNLVFAVLPFIYAWAALKGVAP